MEKKDESMFGMGNEERLSRKSTIKKKVKDYVQAEDFDKPMYRKMSVQMVQTEYLDSLLNQYTPVATQAEIYKRPVPMSAGVLAMTIVRVSSTFSSTTYQLKLSGSKKSMLQAEKMNQSMTKHYKLKIDLPHLKYTRTDDELYIGRLRANFNCNQFYVYDHGHNPRDMKPGQHLMPGQRLRRQFAAVHYMAEDRFMKKVPRHIELYVPEVTSSEQVWAWPDSEKRKHLIYNEY